LGEPKQAHLAGIKEKAVAFTPNSETYAKKLKQGSSKWGAAFFGCV